MQVGRAHLELLVKQAMDSGGLLAAEVAPVRLHTQYLASAGDMEAGFSALVGFQLRHLLPFQVLFRPWAAGLGGLL